MPRPAAIDVAVAAGLAVWAVAEALLLDGDGSRPSACCWALAVTLPLAWRRALAGRRRAARIAALVLARVLVDQGGIGEEGAMPFPALLVAAYSAAVHARTLRLAIAAGVATYVPLVLRRAPLLLRGHGRAGRRGDPLVLRVRSVGRRLLRAPARRERRGRGARRGRGRARPHRPRAARHHRPLDVGDLAAGRRGRAARCGAIPTAPRRISRPSSRPRTRRSWRCAG